MYNLNGKNVTLSRTKDKAGAVTPDSVKNLLDLHGSTLQLLVQ